MANPEHVEVVRGGAASIEEWKRDNPEQILHLSEVDLSRANLRLADLSQANLSKANLHETILTGAGLLEANLSGANLSKSNLSMAMLTDADLSDANLSEAFLSGAFLARANLSKANLSKARASWANLTDVNLSGADLSGAGFFEANLSGANLSRANFSGANLSYTKLKFAKFLETNFSNTDLSGARLAQLDAPNVNLTDATMDYTTIVDSNLAHGVGLETVKHEGPSHIGIGTLILSFRMAGNRFTSELELFFLNAGVPKQLLDVLPRILADVQYYSCFICYGEPDRVFAESLVESLKAIAVSCWLYSMDATPGERVWGEITRKRREAEKIIVICSAQSLVRNGVLKEIEEQIDEDPDKIVPISVDNLWKKNGFWVRRGKRDLKPFLLERNYADFCDESTYNDSLCDLLRGIKRK